jgi:serum/glucocorticoid-regulated kinase 2
MLWFKKLQAKTKSKDLLVDPSSKGHPDGGNSPGILTSVNCSKATFSPSENVPEASPTPNSDIPLPTIQLPTESATSISNHDSSKPTPPSVAPRKLIHVHPTQGPLPSTDQLHVPEVSKSGVLYVRVLEGRGIAIPSGATPESPESSKTQLSAGAPGPKSKSNNPYVVLSYDMNEVIVNSTAGSLSAPVWRNKAKFDLTRDTDLSIALYFRSKSNESVQASHQSLPQDGNNAPQSSLALGTMPSDVCLGTSIISSAQLPSTSNLTKSMWLPLHLPDSKKPTAEIHLQLILQGENKKDTMSIQDFELLKVLGKGNFGKVVVIL